MAAYWLTALFVAVMFGFILYRALLPPRRRPLNQAVFLFQALLVPLLGLAFYVVTAGPPLQSTWLVWPAIALVAVAVLLAVLNIRIRRRLSSGLITYGMLAGQHRLALAVRVCAVLGFSGYLYIFEPAFAVLNIAANAAWACIWVPRRWRAVSTEDSIEVAADAGRVWGVLSDLGNWPLWQVGLDLVSSQPAGPLALGVQLTSRRTGASPAPKERPPASLESRSMIVELVPGSSFTANSLDRDAATTFELRSGGAGTLIRTSSDQAISVLAGILGVGLEIPAATRTFNATTAQSLARLKELLAAPQVAAPR
jgi:hypothetical protein